MKSIATIILPLLVCLPALASKDLDSFTCPGDQKVVKGVNQDWAAHEGGLLRKFIAEFPDVDNDTPVGVIFSWHGLGDSAGRWNRIFRLAAFSTREFPFIVITPIETGMRPWHSTPGAAWDIFVTSDDNREFKLLESVLACLKRTHNIAADRIYSAGFSAGAMISGLLHSRYPKVIAAVFAGSGAWFNDPVQRLLISIPFGIALEINWPDLDEKDHGAALITYGGEGDVFGFPFWTVLSFHETGKEATDFLNQNGRSAVVCTHEGGHRPHPEVWDQEAVEFFKAHRAQQPSPYKSLDDLPQRLRKSCQTSPVTNLPRSAAPTE